MMRDNASFRHTSQDRGHPERMRSAPWGGTAAEGADIPFQETAQAQTCTRREKLARLGLIRGAPWFPSLVWFSLFGVAPWVSLFSPFSSVSGLAFRGFGGPPVVWLGFAPGD